MRYGGFVTALTARCGTAMLAGAICRPGFERQGKEEMNRLSRLSVAGINDPCEVDRTLACALQKYCGKEIWAAGASVRLPEAVFSTGGVIGSPRVEAASADSRIEPLGYGLRLLACPGGPGCAAACDDGVLNQVELDSICPQKRFEALLRYLRMQNVSDFMMVCDGGGPGAQGMILLSLDKKEYEYRL